MSQTNKCISCSCQFDVQMRPSLNLQCGHQVCQICLKEEQPQAELYQCSKKECQKEFCINPQNFEGQRSQQFGSQKEQQQLQLEESKNEDPLKQELKPNNKQIKVQIRTESEEQIDLIVNQGETIDSLKHKIEEQEGIQPDLYEFF